MALPYFFVDHYLPKQEFVELDEEVSRHIISVLRMKTGEGLQLTDGKGNLLTAEIEKEHKKKATVKITASQQVPQPGRKTTIAISLLKNTGRFEWFLEKATEIGVQEIIPLICERTEKTHFRQERMKSILVSAMLQSQQAWLPVLQEPVSFDKFIHQPVTGQQFIAHCLDEQQRLLAQQIDPTASSQIILIGPEGDFTKEEIRSALENQYAPVSLGGNRLRTETAGIVAATLLRLQ